MMTKIKEYYLVKNVNVYIIFKVAVSSKMYLVDIVLTGPRMERGKERVKRLA